MYSKEDGEFAVRTAREVIEKHVRGEEIPDYREKASEKFKSKSGVFVTIDTYPDKELRGCIGFPEPIFPLIDAIVNAAQSASTEDPRFPPVKAKELDKIVVEVSLLTPPQLISVKKPTELPKQVVVGKDGLIIKKGFYSGLLLPQVAVDWKWDAEEFLSQTCWKAGLPPDSWLDATTRFYKFQAEIFAETSPKGNIVEKKLSGPDAGH